MHSIERQSWWKQSLPDPKAGMATAIGAGSGLMAGLIDACLSPRDWSLGGLLGFVLFGAISGFSLWLWCDPERGERLRTITRVVAGVICVMLLPLGFWRAVWHWGGPHWVGMFLGFTCSVSMYAVALVWGVAFLLRPLASRRKQVAKPRRYLRHRLGGVWDPELDG
jgi:hypothetical protein